MLKRFDFRTRRRIKKALKRLKSHRVIKYPNKITELITEISSNYNNRARLQKIEGQFGDYARKKDIENSKNELTRKQIITLRKLEEELNEIDDSLLKEVHNSVYRRYFEEERELFRTAVLSLNNLKDVVKHYKEIIADDDLFLEKDEIRRLKTNSDKSLDLLVKIQHELQRKVARAKRVTEVFYAHEKEMKRIDESVEEHLKDDNFAQHRELKPLFNIYKSFVNHRLNLAPFQNWVQQLEGYLEELEQEMLNFHRSPDLPIIAKYYAEELNEIRGENERKKRLLEKAREKYEMLYNVNKAYFSRDQNLIRQYPPILLFGGEDVTGRYDLLFHGVSQLKQDKRRTWIGALGKREMVSPEKYAERIIKIWGGGLLASERQEHPVSDNYFKAIYFYPKRKMFEYGPVAVSINPGGFALYERSEEVFIYTDKITREQGKFRLYLENKTTPLISKVEEVLGEQGIPFTKV
tara:strand:- start:1318 stop:2712 length:1395 start_codon:yes stop_codon:yes gene_type:complete